MKRDVLLALAIATAGLAGGIALHAWWATGVIEDAWRGESWAWLDAVVERRRAMDPESRDLDYFQWVGRTVSTRAAMIWLAAVAGVVAWRHRRRVAEVVTRLFRETGPPLDLAVFRIVVFGTLLFYFGPRDDLAVYSSLPEVLQFPPTGLGPVLATLPISPEVAAVVKPAFLVCCVAAMLGLFTRIGTVGALVLGLYVLGVPQMYGKVNHSHHLIWFAALLAVSPCADAFSLDALIRRRPRPAPARCYALPLRFVWLLIGVIYFFPGFWKLWMGGIDWIFSDNLKFQMYHLWSTHEAWQPMVRIDRWPVLMYGGAFFTVAFELAFIVLIFFPRGRILAMLGGVAFHTMSARMLNIRFTTLMWCYVAMIPWGRWLRVPPGSAVPRHRLWPTAAMGATLLAGNIAMGIAANNNGWPFACYPRFSYPIFEPERARIEVELVETDGVVTPLDLADASSRFRTARWIGLVRNVLLTSDANLRAERLQAIAELSADLSADELQAVRFYRVTYSTIPEERDEPPLRRELLHELRP